MVGFAVGGMECGWAGLVGSVGGSVGRVRMGPRVDRGNVEEIHTSARIYAICAR